MSLIKMELDGVREVGLRFEEFPDHLRDDLRTEINSLTNELKARIGRAMPKDSGKMRSSLWSKIYEDVDRVNGVITVAHGDGDLSRQAAGLEYGSNGKPQDVKSHNRRLDHFWKEKLAAPRTVIVKAFNRKPNLKEHRFLRGPAQGMRSTIMQKLNAVVKKATDEANR